MRIVFIFVVLTFLCCSPSSEAPLVTDGPIQIEGKFKLTESYLGTGGETDWQVVENGPEFVFAGNGTFTSTHYETCSTGTYVIADDVLQLQYNCPDFENNAIDEDGFITYAIAFGANFFILSPTSGPTCIEGCSYRYTLIKD